MDPLSPLPIFGCLLIALITIYAIGKIFHTPLPSNRISTIDGLRGYLGIAVFFHHACLWYFFLKTETWEASPSNFHNHLGKSGVALFFMITGFLFFSKILQADRRPIDWTRLYISRILRLLPLYLVAMAFLFLIVGILSDWKLNQSVPALALSLIRWLSFTISGAPDINAVENTSRILASVTWSLRFEWSFYILLPVIAFLAGKRPPSRYLTLSIIGMAMLLVATPEPIRFSAFAGGMAAAAIVRSEKVRNFCAHPLNTITIAACLLATVSFFPSAYEIGAMMLLTAVFTLIAGGNTGFGIFTSHVSRLLGELAYGIYLLHGLLLFSIFKFGVGFDKAATLSPNQYWTIIAVATPALIIATFAAFKYVEKPSMLAVNKTTYWAKNIFNKKRNQKGTAQATQSS